MGMTKEEVLNKFRGLKFLSSLEVWTECIDREYWRLKDQESERKRKEVADEEKVLAARKLKKQELARSINPELFKKEIPTLELIKIAEQFKESGSETLLTNGGKITFLFTQKGLIDNEIVFSIDGLTALQERNTFEMDWA